MAGFLDAHPEVGLAYAPMDIVKDDGELLMTYADAAAKMSCFDRFRNAG